LNQFFLKNEIQFNVVQSKNFKVMPEAVGNCGPNLKDPSYYELRDPVLRKELEYTDRNVEGS